MTATVYTVGHSTRSTEELLALLEENGVELLVDVRRYPASRRHPHFGREPLARAVEAAGLAYRHEEALGGRRGPPDPESPNAGWRSEGFRAYADHLHSEEARAALGRLRSAAEDRTAAVMCAEAVPWRCHRQLIADWLVAGGWEVRHILAPGRTDPHDLREMARVLEDGRVIYPDPAGQGELFED